jgi:phosphohistidine swiveling domain-containing protein
MHILPFTSTEASLQTAGGKGANLARLTRAGFAVPTGFIVPTDAYAAFVSANHLPDVIAEAIIGLTPDDAARLEAASDRIRAAFSAGALSTEMETDIRAAYADMGAGPVAVRSSATTEDLPDLSFAGQQDTYLNVVGADALLQAIVNCWSSLWTARAIGYRIRNAIGHDAAALAVVVQAMVQSEVSGVMFTANPLTGLLSETVIEATFGLGEALVSGQVEPDHFVVDAASGAILGQTLGTKATITRSKVDGGVETHQEDAGTRQTLASPEVQRLAMLGQQVQQALGAPQDIEWAQTDGHLYLLQSRPITSLFPVPEVSFDPLIVWFSFGAVQGLVGPMTPLGRDTIRHVLAGGGALFGLRLNPEELKVFVSAGERIWTRVSDVLRNPLGNRLVGGLLEFIEPGGRQTLLTLAADPRLGAGTGRLKISTLCHMAQFFLPALPRIIHNVLRPERARAKFDAAIESYLAAVQIAPASDRFGRLANVVAFMRSTLANVFGFLLPKFIPVFAPSMAALTLLTCLAGNRDELALEVTRGLPRNVTTEMDLALWKTASTIRAETDALHVFRDADAAALARQYMEGTLPTAAQSAVTRFMEKYGMRGVGEIDFGQPRWREDPTPVMHSLKSYLDITPDVAPDAQFARGAQAAEAAIESLATAVRQRRGGWRKEKLVRAAARRIRILMGARESPKFFAIRTMGIARKALLEVGEAFVAAGTLTRADNLVFLSLAELEALSRQEDRDWRALVAERRAAYERELRRRQVPRVLVSDGRAFYDGVGAATDTGDVITGSPVSPGAVEGIVHVVLDPRNTQLTPGEILVCPGTDPAWTPLFMAAGGLITEVGGMMTHGSVVAREYGIPAVVGVHQATLRLKDGQRIRLDGTTGQIVVVR